MEDRKRANDHKVCKLLHICRKFGEFFMGCIFKVLDSNLVFNVAGLMTYKLGTYCLIVITIVIK